MFFSIVGLGAGIFGFQYDLRLMLIPCTTDIHQDMDENQQQECKNAIVVERYQDPFHHIVRYFIGITTLAAMISLICGVYFKKEWIRSFYSQKEQRSGIQGIYQFYLDKMKTNVLPKGTEATQLHTLATQNPYNTLDDVHKLPFHAPFMNWQFVFEFAILLIMPYPHV